VEREIQYRLCRKCKQTKKRIHDGFWSAKDKKWVNDDGVAWNGNTCPECHRENALVNRMKNYYSEPKAKRTIKISTILKSKE
jgi:hypothetical protein